ncbi:hypothetical protein PoB_005407800 [Plakobranchus ocellatus]|uniref:Uncharacterized protein n=1 Tax=Plakobranchus ocellatus TaxID=259542 RepID=A0AAV4C7U5_9GAST|nr:hypothetical protein PoB_005407800 [Plakobranchus ocellatus]
MFAVCYGDTTDPVLSRLVALFFIILAAQSTCLGGLSVVCFVLRVKEFSRSQRPQHFTILQEGEEDDEKDGKEVEEEEEV